MAELEQQTREVLAGEPVTMEIFPFQYAFNLFSHNAPMTDNGYNEEEMKMVKETHKIWGRAIQAVFIKQLPAQPDCWDKRLDVVVDAHARHWYNYAVRPPLL